MAAEAVGGQAGYLLGAGNQPAGMEQVGNLALAVLNAVAGDNLGQDLTPLAIRMAVRANGCDVGLTAEQIAVAFPYATPRLAVFVHGLAETENSWHRGQVNPCPTATACPASSLGAVVGDLLVQPASAHGRRGSRQHVPFPAEPGRGLGGMHHFDLLNHADVWHAMRIMLRAAAR